MMTDSIAAVLVMLSVAGMTAQDRMISERAVLIEAERFEDVGGWVEDSQFMDQMGSCFLLAHGLGLPVADARTVTTLKQAGFYRVWVRSRDWVAPWGAHGAPGRFQLRVGGKVLGRTFGSVGAKWHWQDGGVEKLEKGDIELALHDLTGFEGRCDAILLVPVGEEESEPIFIPPDEGPRLTELRRELSGVDEEPGDAGAFDLVVVGGGIAGTCAAVSAARHGLSVALIQDRPVLGGNNSSEVRVWLQGARNLGSYPHVGDIVAELEQERTAHYGPENTAELYEDEKKLEVVRREPRIELRLLHRANGVEMEGKRIQAVIAEEIRTGRRWRFRSGLVADCTGDGCIGALAGADHEMSIPHMGQCNLWNVAETNQEQPFPRCPWALDLSKAPFPGRKELDPLKLGGWYWESGFDHDPITDNELIRDWNFRAAYGAWDALKNVDGAFSRHRLNWMAYVSGKRESRRLLGDVVLSKEDLVEGKVYEDGCVPTGWKIDVHEPDRRYDGSFSGEAFIAEAKYTDYRKPYWIPYRCLYSRNIDNLFMAGRDISVTHEALGATRVMRTGGCMGEVVGIAASLCVQEKTAPRGVWEKHPQEFKKLLRRPAYARPDAQLPASLKEKVGANVAVGARVSVSGQLSGEYRPEHVNDGLVATWDNGGRWISSAGDNAWVEFVLPESREITAIRVVSGYRQGSVLTAPIEDFQLQQGDGSGWEDIGTARVSKNQAAECWVEFPPARSERFRLLIKKSHQGLARIWEVELYESKKP